MLRLCLHRGPLMVLWGGRRSSAAAFHFNQRTLMHCQHCHEPFVPKRSTARYCSAAHRLAAHRESLDRP